VAARKEDKMTLQRWLYLASRTAGDVNAAKRGTLPKRLVRRTVTRSLLRPYNQAWRRF